MSGVLVDTYLFPPFSILNSRSKEWKDRYKKWLSLGFRDDLGRASPEFESSYGLHSGLTWNRLQVADPHFYMKKRAVEKSLAIELSDTEFIEKHYSPPESVISSGTSSFDPVLAEVLLLWFSTSKSMVVDPFSGGPTRGIVSGVLGRDYWGVDLLPDQVEYNRAQLEKVKDRVAGSVSWQQGDSFRAKVDYEVPECDFILTCPPYFTLERYSDDLRDLSNVPMFDSYMYRLTRIFERYLSVLKSDRFFAVVLTDVRAKDSVGGYLSVPYRLVSALEKIDTVRLYNDFVLVNNSASLAIRTGRIFNATRKYGRTHQNVLVFCKGDPRKATKYVRGGEASRW